MQNIQLQTHFFVGATSIDCALALAPAPPPASRLLTLSEAQHSLSAHADVCRPLTSPGLLSIPGMPVPSLVLHLPPLQLSQSVTSPQKSFWKAMSLQSGQRLPPLLPCVCLGLAL